MSDMWTPEEITEAEERVLKQRKTSETTIQEYLAAKDMRRKQSWKHIEDIYGLRCDNGCIQFADKVNAMELCKDLTLHGEEYGETKDFPTKFFITVFAAAQALV
jgi:hypothetical protein